MLICGRQVIAIMKKMNCTWDKAVEIYKQSIMN